MRDGVHILIEVRPSVSRGDVSELWKVRKLYEKNSRQFNIGRYEVIKRMVKSSKSWSIEGCQRCRNKLMR